MIKIESFEGHRWFIWTIVFIVVSLGGLATYIVFVSDLDSSQIQDFGSIVLRSNKMPKSTTNTFISLGDFIPGKKFTNMCADGEWGIFMPNGSLPVVWPTEGGISQPQEDHALAQWYVKDSQLFITGSSFDDGIHKDFTWQTSYDGSKYLNENFDGSCGLEIGNSFNPGWGTGWQVNLKGLTPQDQEKYFEQKFPSIKK